MNFPILMKFPILQNVSVLPCSSKTAQNVDEDYILNMAYYEPKNYVIEWNVEILR